MARPKKARSSRPDKIDVKDAASLGWRSVLLGGGVFDNTSEHPNKKGWEIFELGQKSFWAVPSAIDFPSGCRFRNRCTFANERCAAEEPKLLELRPAHTVACHGVEEGRIRR